VISLSVKRTADAPFQELKDICVFFFFFFPSECKVLCAAAAQVAQILSMLMAILLSNALASGDVILCRCYKTLANSARRGIVDG
jgi:hypothetical protein